MKKFIKTAFIFSVLILGLLFLPLRDFAQNSTNSPYSRYGIGDISSRGFCRNDALGGLGIGLRSNKNLNIINPASYSAIDSLTFTFEFGFKNKTAYIQSSDQNELYNDINISYLACGFPIAKWWYGSFGLLPYSSIGYNIKEINNSDSIPKEIHYTGSGGVNKFYIGNTFKLHKTLSIGFNASYLFGTLEQARTVNFTDTTVLYMNLKTRNFINVNDIYLNFGMQYNNSIKEKYQYTVGIIFDNQNKINATRNTLATRFYNKGGSAIIDSVLNTPGEKGNIVLPLNYGIGFSIKNDSWLFGADYYRQNWADVSFFGKNDSLANSNTISVGSEYIPDKNSISKYWNKVSYRFGGHFTNTYLKFSEKNEQLKDFGFSFGLGLPVKKTRSLLNVSIEIGQRGTTNKSLIRETYGMISVNFSLSDIWFMKTRFD
ncbi:MAG: hypothetical protein HY958_08110 [Bacteroidia bacterium]|nr:hypothetical protein [Bacteroidia bacterium]